MKVTFWGTRGSIAAPGPTTTIYGGNTSCVEVRVGDDILIFDAGTGIRGLGLALMEECRGSHSSASVCGRHHDSSVWVGGRLGQQTPRRPSARRTVTLNCGDDLHHPKGIDSR